MRLPHRLLAILLMSVSGAVPAAAADDATSGALTVTGNGDQRIELPLKHTKVSIEVTAFVARTTIEQVFVNALEAPVEAVYTFPLGDRAAVDDFELTVGDRTIRGEIKRREEARRTYETARSAGYHAALLEQERSNIFTQSVANLEPGKDVTVRLRTVETLRYERGRYRLAFPLVVGHRYMSADSAVAEPSRIVPPRLAPGTRSGHDVAIDVAIDAGVPLTDIRSESHRIVTSRNGAASARVRLAPDDTIPNKDFQLSWSVSSERPAVGFLAHRDGLDGFFTLLIQPKGEIDATEATPKEITFVVDTSGSMSGVPLQASQRFIARALHELGPRDTFNIIRFAGDNQILSNDPLPNAPVAIERAIAWVNAQQGGGGTEMLRAMRAAFARPADPDRLRVVIFLTDGEVGDDEEILREIGTVLGDARIDTVGIGSSVNRYLLDRMADLGHGSFVTIRPDERADDALEAFRSWATRPYLTGLTVDWGALPVADISPEPLRDLGSGQTLTLVGRYLKSAAGDVVVRGKLAGRYWEQRLHVVLPEAEGKHDALASLWARRRIEDLLLVSPGSASDSVRAEVTSLALAYRLLSPFTSFVAVDDAVVVNPSGVARTVRQALPVPEGVSFEGIFGKNGPAALKSDADDEREPEDSGADDEEDAPDAAVRTITVIGEKGAQVDLDSNETSTMFSSDFIADLPVAGRFYQEVFQISPGAQDPDEDGNPNVNGARERDFRTQVGGAASVDPLTGTFINLVTGDSVEELTLVTAGAGAEFGRAQGGFAQIIPTGSPPPPLPGGAATTSAQASLDSGDDEDDETPPADARDRLRDAAFRVLADLADDGKLSPADGKPALAALLAAQVPEGAIAEDVKTHAIATWALAEAAAAMPKETWIAAARTKAVGYLAQLAEPDGWPKRPGGKLDGEATLWAVLVLSKAQPSAVTAVKMPTGDPSEEYKRLREAISAGRSGPTTQRPIGHGAFDRLVATVGRGHLLIERARR